MNTTTLPIRTATHLCYACLTRLHADGKHEVIVQSLGHPIVTTVCTPCQAIVLQRGVETQKGK